MALLEQALRAADPAVSDATSSIATWQYVLGWYPSSRPVPSSTERQRSGTWLVFSDNGPIGRTVVTYLTAHGHRPMVVTRDSARDMAEVVGEFSRHSDCQGVLYLWALEADGDAGIVDSQDVVCQQVVRLARALADADLADNPPLWLISLGAQAVIADSDVTAPLQAPLWGLGRTLTSEAPSLHTRLVDLDRTVDSVVSLINVLGAPGIEDQIALRNGRVFTPRLRSATDAGTRSAATKLTISERGILEGLSLLGTDLPALAADEVRIKVSHASLSYHDVLVAQGIPPWNGPGYPALGVECAGVVEATGAAVGNFSVGQPVMAAAVGSLASHVNVKSCLVAPIPHHISPAEAATIPVTILSAYYALVTVGRLQHGERVLIHTATGGVGQAAVQIAEATGAEIYATAGSETKRALLEAQGVQGVSGSRSLEYGDDFAAIADGRGFDVIVNTLAGDAIPKNLSLLAPYGRYLELTRRDIYENTPLPMGLLAKNMSISIVDVLAMLVEEPSRAGDLLAEVCGLFRDGTLAAVSLLEFPVERAAEAFQLMARTEHTGKVVIAFPATASATASALATGSNKDTIPAPGDSRVHPDATYLITGGMGGIGPHLARWLADRGARHLLLLGRTHHADDPWRANDVETPGRASGILDSLVERGIEVEYAACDVGDAHALRRVAALRERRGSPPVRGVFHLAGVVGHVTLNEVQPDELEQILHPKVSGTWVLHEQFPDLDLFVMFSSAATQLSSPFRGCYAAANAFMDAIGPYRRSRGLPATVINWGFWSEAGMTARWERDNERSSLPQGMRRFTPAEGLDTLGQILDQDRPHTTVLPTDWEQWASAYPEASQAPILQDLVPRGAVPTAAPTAAASAPLPPVRTDSRGERPVPPAPTPAVAANEMPPTPREAAPMSTGEIEQSLTRLAATILGASPERIRAQRPLVKQGMDSLMAAQLRSQVAQDFAVRLPIISLLKDASVASLARRIHSALEDRPE